MARLPPRPLTFDKNESYAFRRGFAAKIPGELARDRFGLDTQESLVWLSPDGLRILTDEQANLNNSRRRAALTNSDTWRDLKAVEPDRAREIGWNGFQR